MMQQLRGLCLLSALCSAAHSQIIADPLIGSWQGTLRVGVAELELALHISKDRDEYAATFDSITQGVNGIPVASLTRVGNQITAQITAIGADFVATFAPSKTARDPKLSGVWKQGGRDFPLVMKRGTKPALRRPQHPIGELPYTIETVAFGHDPARPIDDSFQVGGNPSVSLAGTLTLPPNGGPHPAAVLITGSGPQDRDEALFGHKPFLVIADHLTRNGVAVLRYDDRGTASSTGDFTSATTKDFATDVRAAIRFLMTRKDIDHDRIGLIGHSEGGVIAPMVATGPDADLVAFAVLLAPPAVKIGDIITHQSKLIGRANGSKPGLIQINVEMTRAVIAAVIANRDDLAARAESIQKVAAEYWPKLPDYARAEMTNGIDDLVASLARLNSPWMNWLAHYDPAPTLRDLTCDVLAMFGGKDLQVDPKQNRPPLEAALMDHSGSIKVVTIEGVNHLFQHSQTGNPTEYGVLEETFAPEALELMQRWIAARTKH